MAKIIFTLLFFATVTANAQLVCVSRDNDGISPYVFGIRKDVDIEKIPGTKFGSIQDCQMSLTYARYFRTSALACVSRDGDGMNPWILGMFSYQRGFERIADSASSSLSDCIYLAGRLIHRHHSETVLYCTSRDRDSMGPYVAASINLENGLTRKGSDHFSDLQSCWASLSY